mmetsp:Transcript_6765/g.12504  ORF Transcript_6765/g.12504 Transcript_6765/m.12504 type:complete len:758 (+) Transcript_6765:442-2715(+)
MQTTHKDGTGPNASEEELIERVDKVLESRLNHFTERLLSQTSGRGDDFKLDKIESRTPGSPFSPEGGNRNRQRTAGSVFSVSSDEPDAVPELGRPSLARLGSEPAPYTRFSHDDLLQGGGSATSPNSAQYEEGNLPDLGYTFDCDPRAWILAAGRLEKKRDGSWKGGWCQRFFVLSSSTLYYFRMPRRSTNGENSGLLGDERGQIKVGNIQNIRNTDSNEGSLIHLECDDIKKKALTQSSTTSIVLRAASPGQAHKWAHMIRSARDQYRQAKDRGGRLLDGYISQSAYESLGQGSGAQATALSAKERTDLDSGIALRTLIEKQVMPLITAGADLVHVTEPRATHIDPYFALSLLVLINASCFFGPQLNEIAAWMLANIAFLTFVVYYEKLANEHDSSVLRHNRTIKILQEKFDKAVFYIKQRLDTTEEQANSLHLSPTTPSAAESPISPAEETKLSVVEESTALLGKAELASSLLREALEKKPPCGTTMDRAEYEDGKFCSWSPCDASVFKLRQVQYKATRAKAPSAAALYDIAGMDLLKGDTRLENVQNLVSLPPVRDVDDVGLIAQSKLPRVVMVNIQTPLKSPSPWGGDDPGVSVVFYFAIKPETAQAAVSGSDRPEIKLWQKFVGEFETNDDMRRRFKGIGIAANFEDLGLGSSMSTFNGKPVMLYKTAAIKYDKERGVLEVNVMVHKFGLVARGLFNQFKNKAPEIKIRAGFLIQGEDDSELPECILGCTKVHRLEFHRATHIKDLAPSTPA